MAKQSRMLSTFSKDRNSVTILLLAPTLIPALQDLMPSSGSLDTSLHWHILMHRGRLSLFLSLSPFLLLPLSPSLSHTQDGEI